MPVHVHIPGPLRELSGGRALAEIEATPATVRGALDALYALHPGLRDRLVDEQGDVRTHVNVFVGTENIRWTGGLETALPEGAEITIVPSVSGG